MAVVKRPTAVVKNSFMRATIFILVAAFGTGALAVHAEDAADPGPPPVMIIVTNPPPANVRVAQPLPEFALPGVDGGTLHSSNLTGKALLVWIFAASDRPCRRQLPALVELHNQYTTNGFAVLGVALNETGVGPVRRFADEHKITFPIVMADMKLIQDIGQITEIPTTLVVVPQGAIVNRHIGVTDKAVLEADVRGSLNVRTEAP